MADIQTPVAVPAETVEQSTAPIIAEPAITTDAAAPNAQTSAGDAALPAVDDTKHEGDAAEEPSTESKSIEEGHLGYKAQGLSFPKNLLGSKEFFFFGSDAVEAKVLEVYKKSQKSADGALENIAWAAHTGKGLLFSGDKTAPHNIINLAHATEPEIDGNKFHITTKGNKHTFKAASVTERDMWVAQIKTKIVEAKEIATSVTESEAYKTALETLKPAQKEEAKAAEPSAIQESTDAARTDEAAKEEADAAKEEPSKRRSASRKRASFFGFGKKDILPKEDIKTEGAAPAEVEDSAVAGTTGANAEDPPVEETVVPTEATEEPVAETSKPVASKRNSFFGGVFSKKEKKTSEPKAIETAEAADEEAEVANESAPVIPPVEATSSLTDDVNAAEPTTTEAAVTETKTDVKEKRKSSLPFFSKRDASPANGEEKTKGGAFSKFRATIKGKGAAKVDEAKEESSKIEESATKSVVDAQDKTKDTVADIKEQATKAAEGEPETKADETAPTVTASA